MAKKSKKTMALIDPGFPKGIIAKNSVLVQRHRRFPALIFLVIKPSTNFQFLSLLLKNRNILAPYYNYHLNPTLIFNINLLARFAGEKSTGTKERLFKHFGSESNINQVYSNRPGNESNINQVYSFHPGSESNINRFYSSGTSTLTAASYSYSQLLKISNINRFLFHRSGIVSTSPVINQEIEQTDSRLTSLTLQANRHIIDTNIIEKQAKTTVHHAGSMAVFNPSLTLATLNQTSVHINGSLPSSAGSFVSPVKTGGTASSGNSSPSASTPALNYANSFGTALEDMKKTVTRIEEQIKEERKLVQKSFTEESSHPVPGNRSDTPINNTNLNQLTDQVYRMMEKKIRIERERRGW